MDKSCFALYSYSCRFALPTQSLQLLLPMQNGKEQAIVCAFTCKVSPPFGQHVKLNEIMPLVNSCSETSEEPQIVMSCRIVMCSQNVMIMRHSMSRKASFRRCETRTNAYKNNNSKVIPRQSPVNFSGIGPRTQAQLST